MIDHNVEGFDLSENVFHFTIEHLKSEGALVAKVLRGGTEGQLLNDMKKVFKKVSHFKPKSSRAESCEIFVVAQGFRGKAKGD